jgi:hypothetical protein
LQDFFVTITVADSGVTALAGALIGTLADIAGTIEVIDEFISKNTQGSIDLKNELDGLKATIKQEFADLREDVRAGHKLEQYEGLDVLFAQAQAVFDDVKLNLNATQEFRTAQVQVCQAALNIFEEAEERHWKTVFLDELYYGQDHGDSFAGVITPQPDPDGTVFRVRYVVPLYLRGLHMFMVVAAAFFQPDFAEKFKTPLQTYAARLLKVHDASQNGIVPMRKPTRDEILPGLGWAEDWYSLFGHAPGDVRITYQPYGVVHTYSGYSSISFHPNDIPDFDVFDVEQRRLLALHVIIGLNFRIENEWKKTYVAIGLRQLRNTINDLRKLTGDPALPEFERSKGWSLSETYRLLDTMAPLNDAGRPDFSAFKILSTVAAVAAFGGLTAKRPVSWRGALAAVLTAERDPRSFHLP